jgi:ATP-dependent Zn protease
LPGLGGSVKQDESTAATILAGSKLLQQGKADVFRIRERTRRRRIWKLLAVLGGIDAYVWYRYATHNPFDLPTVGPETLLWVPILLILLLAVVMLAPLLSGRSPHMVVHPEQIEIGLTNVRGLDTQVDEVVRTLDVFLGYATFRDELGGTPRRGILFEGPPGTGKTYLAKAMAKQAGVPFLFASSTSFQSVWFGMSAARVRSFFRRLRKLARREGGAIGFIDEIDAIGGHRRGVAASPPGTRLDRTVSPMFGASDAGLVNELLIQMQSIDKPPATRRLRHRAIEFVNRFLRPENRIAVGKPEYNNILLIAATNRADDLDGALLRPGRFDQRLYFDLPTKQGRRDLIDFFLDRKVHHMQLEDYVARERLAHDTFGYTPVMIEHTFDEALLIALRNGRREMTLDDVYGAKLTEEIGLKQPVAYTDGERAAIATHEAGHATVAYFLGKGRRLEVLSIIKRRQALGLLAHGDIEERFTRSRSEVESHVAIALGGMVAEETFLGESGTGPASDLAVATTLVAQMVGSFGMAGSLISYDAVSEGPIGSKNLVGKVLGDADAKQRVEDILTRQKERVAELLDANRDVVVELREALIERDELVGDDILVVIEKALANRN